MALGEAWCDPPACHAGKAGSIPARVVKAWLVSIPVGPVAGRFRKEETGSTPGWEKASLNLNPD